MIAVFGVFVCLAKIWGDPTIFSRPTFCVALSVLNKSLLPLCCLYISILKCTILFLKSYIKKYNLIPLQRSIVFVPAQKACTGVQQLQRGRLGRIFCGALENDQAATLMTNPNCVCVKAFEVL